MSRHTKTPLEKLRTKINNLVSDQLIDTGNSLNFQDTVIAEYDDFNFTYTKKRYYPTKLESIVEDDFSVVIPITHANLKYISSSSPNPPLFIKSLLKTFRDLGYTLNSITIGAVQNEIQTHILNITSNLYDDLNNINNEENKIKAHAYNNRIAPFLNQNYNIVLPQNQIDRDFGVLLREIIASNQITQADIQELTNQLQVGSITNVVIQHQVNKQVEWLIEGIEKILDAGKLNRQSAKDLGNSLFAYTKTSISGPEHLMEKILTDYGQFSLFGVPALINTNKYVMNATGLPRVQFDLLLINHLGEVEVVELKRSDTIILDFDSQRNKFYPSVELSKAIAQTERYITSLMKDNDEEYKIEGKKVKDYLNEQIGNIRHFESVRPTGLIIVGSNQSICLNYHDLEQNIKDKISLTDYNNNCDRAFRELKDSLKNIKIISYSELLESAKTRLELSTNTTP